MIGKQRRTPGVLTLREVFFCSPPSSPSAASSSSSSQHHQYLPNTTLASTSHNPSVHHQYLPNTTLASTNHNATPLATSRHNNTAARKLSSGGDSAAIVRQPRAVSDIVAVGGGGEAEVAGNSGTDEKIKRRPMQVTGYTGPDGKPVMVCNLSANPCSLVYS